MTIKETVQSAFELAHDATKLRDAISKELPHCVGRDHATAHRVCVVLGDMISGFNMLEDKIAEIRALGRYMQH